jgi:hypothetical protein
VSPGAQLSAVDGILVETLPLLELPLSKGLVLFCIPYEHFWLVVDTGGLAYSLDHARRVVEQLISVHNADLDALRVAVGTVGLAGLASRLRADDSLLAEVIEQLTQLRVSRLVLSEVIPTCQLIQGRECAAVVARNAVLGVSDEENKVVCCEKVSGEDSRVSLLNSRIVRVRFAGLIFPSLYGRKFVGVCANAATVVGHGRADGRRPRLALRRNPVLCHVFDESALALLTPLASDQCRVASTLPNEPQNSTRWSCDLAEGIQPLDVTLIEKGKASCSNDAN